MLDKSHNSNNNRASRKINRLSSMIQGLFNNIVSCRPMAICDTQRSVTYDTLCPYYRTSYDISYASDWLRWPSRPIRSLRYIVTCTRIRTLNPRGYFSELSHGCHSRSQNKITALSDILLLYVASSYINDTSLYCVAWWFKRHQSPPLLLCIHCSKMTY